MMAPALMLAGYAWEMREEIAGWLASRDWSWAVGLGGFAVGGPSGFAAGYAAYRTAASPPARQEGAA